MFENVINYVDLLVIGLGILYILSAVQAGVFSVLGRLVAFFGALAIAFWGYSYAQDLFVEQFAMPSSFARAIGFLSLFFFTQFLLNLIFGLVFSFIPEKMRYAWWSKVLALAPAVVDAAVLAGVILIFIVLLPFAPKAAQDITESRSGAFALETMSRLEGYANQVFGEALQDTITFLTVQPETAERVEIPYKPAALHVDEGAEEQMLRLVNEERARAGVSALVTDEEIVQVARAHSKDMWEKGYFSLINLEGKDPFDRMRDEDIEFSAAGENIALAPTTALAHRGLMNSPGHRRNILDPKFQRVGIGVIDGGVYGKMFTQNFAL